MELNDKVSLLTGGASGLGFAYGEELLRNGLKHLAILDLATSTGEECAIKLNAKYGDGRVIFIQCDVTNQAQFAAAFDKVIEKFGGLDIVINNAGIVDEPRYELMIDINYTGVVRGTLLALKHLRKDKGGKGGVIVNIASIYGLDPMAFIPIYDGTKHAVIGLSRSFALPYHYEKTGVRVLTVCPGVTDTKLLSDIGDNSFLDFIDVKVALDSIGTEYVCQKVDTVAQGLVKVIKSAETGSVWVAEGGKPIYEVSIPDRFTMKVKDH